MHFLCNGSFLTCNSAKSWFRELEKNQRVEEMLWNVCDFFQIFPSNTLLCVDRSPAVGSEESG